MLYRQQSVSTHSLIHSKIFIAMVRWYRESKPKHACFETQLFCGSGNISFSFSTFSTFCFTLWIRTVFLFLFPPALQSDIACHLFLTLLMFIWYYLRMWLYVLTMTAMPVSSATRVLDNYAEMASVHRIQANEWNWVVDSIRFLQANSKWLSSFYNGNPIAMQEGATQVRNTAIRWHFNIQVSIKVEEIQRTETEVIRVIHTQKNAS